MDAHQSDMPDGPSWGHAGPPTRRTGGNQFVELHSPVDRSAKSDEVESVPDVAEHSQEISQVIQKTTARERGDNMPESPQPAEASFNEKKWIAGTPGKSVWLSDQDSKNLDAAVTQAKQQVQAKLVESKRIPESSLEGSGNRVWYTLRNAIITNESIISDSQSSQRDKDAAADRIKKMRLEQLMIERIEDRLKYEIRLEMGAGADPEAIRTRVREIPAQEIAQLVGDLPLFHTNGHNVELSEFTAAQSDLINKLTDEASKSSAGLSSVRSEAASIEAVRSDLQKESAERKIVAIKDNIQEDAAGIAHKLQDQLGTFGLTVDDLLKHADKFGDLFATYSVDTRILKRLNPTFNERGAGRRDAVLADDDPVKRTTPSVARARIGSLVVDYMDHMNAKKYLDAYLSSSQEKTLQETIDADEQRRKSGDRVTYFRNDLNLGKNEALGMLVVIQNKLF